MIRIFKRSKPKANGTFPIVLSITKNKRTKVISLGISTKKQHWNGEKFKRSHPNCSTYNNLIKEKIDEAEAIIAEFETNGINFSLKEFENKFRKTNASSTISKFWLEKITDLNEAGRTGNAQVLISTYNSFFTFISDKSLEFRDMNYRMLEKYEVFLRKKGNTNGGIGVKMRCIRALYNQAINAGIIDEKNYPFKKFKVSKFKSRQAKRALTRDEVKMIENLDLEKHSTLTDARNYYIFSYYAQGMNFYDMVKLQWKNINAERILYTRSKTKEKFNIVIVKPLQEILNYYKDQNRSTSYVFPILLKEKMTPIQIENRKKKALKSYNKKLKLISGVLGIDKHITSYTARHSFATNLKFMGVSTDIVSQSLGHKDIKVTQNYLKDFEDEIIDEAIKKLLEEDIINYNKNLQ